MKNSDDPFAPLGLSLREATPETLRSAARSLLRAAHPDLGGTVEGFLAASAAVDAARRALARLPCPLCAGRGRLTHRSSFAPLEVRCAKCRGTGTKFPSPEPRPSSGGGDAV